MQNSESCWRPICLGVRTNTEVSSWDLTNAVLCAYKGSVLGIMRCAFNNAGPRRGGGQTRYATWGRMEAPAARDHRAIRMDSHREPILLRPGARASWRRRADQRVGSLHSVRQQWEW